MRRSRSPAVFFAVATVRAGAVCCSGDLGVEVAGPRFGVAGASTTGAGGGGEAGGGEDDPGGGVGAGDGAGSTGDGAGGTGSGRTGVGGGAEKVRSCSRTGSAASGDDGATCAIGLPADARGNASGLASMTVRVTAGGAAIRTECTPFRPTSVPGNPTAAASAATAEIAVTIRGHVALMLQPPSADTSFERHRQRGPEP